MNINKTKPIKPTLDDLSHNLYNQQIKYSYSYYSTRNMYNISKNHNLYMKSRIRKIEFEDFEPYSEETDYQGLYDISTINLGFTEISNICISRALGCVK